MARIIPLPAPLPATVHWPHGDWAEVEVLGVPAKRDLRAPLELPCILRAFHAGPGATFVGQDETGGLVWLPAAHLRFGPLP